MKTKILRILILVACVIGISALSQAQTITCNVNIVDGTSYSGNYYVYCQVFHINGTFYTVTSTNPVTVNGSGTFSRTVYFNCSVPYDANNKIYKVRLKISRVTFPLKYDTQDSGPYTTDQLYDAGGLSFPTFYIP